MATSGKLTPSVRNAIRSIIAANQEHKIATINTPAGANWTTGGTLAEISRLVVQGDNIFQRNGDQITVKDLDIRMHTTSTGAGNSTTFRVIVFADMTADAAIPGVADVLDIADFRSAYQHFNRQRRRFKIFHDQLYVNVFGTVNQERTLRLHFPKLSHKVYYNGTAGTAADNGKGALFLIVIASAAGNGGWSFDPQITYTDS